MGHDDNRSSSEGKNKTTLTGLAVDFSLIQILGLTHELTDGEESAAPLTGVELVLLRPHTHKHTNTVIGTHLGQTQTHTNTPAPSGPSDPIEGPLSERTFTRTAFGPIGVFSCVFCSFTRCWTLQPCLGGTHPRVRVQAVRHFARLLTRRRVPQDAVEHILGGRGPGEQDEQSGDAERGRQDAHCGCGDT